MAQRRPSIADEMQAFLKDSSRARSDSIDAINASVDACKESAAAAAAKSEQLASKGEELQYELEVQGTILAVSVDLFLVPPPDLHLPTAIAMPCYS